MCSCVGHTLEVTELITLVDGFLIPATSLGLADQIVVVCTILSMENTYKIYCVVFPE